MMLGALTSPFASACVAKYQPWPPLGNNDHVSCSWRKQATAAGADVL